MKNNKIIKFITLTLLFILVNELLKSLLNYDKLLQNYLAEQLTSSQIDNFFTFQKKWQYFSYTFILIYLLLKTSSITLIIYMGSFFISKKEILFKQLWTIIINAEFLFLLVPLIKIIWFYYFKSTINIEDIQYFYPLSALNIIGYIGLEPWLIYPFQILNLFEVAYVIYLGYQIGKLTKTNTDSGLKIVAYSYVPALLLWVTVVMFLTLNYS